MHRRTHAHTQTHTAVCAQTATVLAHQMNVIPVLAGPLFCSVSTMSESGLPCNSLPEKTVENVMIPHIRLKREEQSTRSRRRRQLVLPTTV